MSTRRISVTGLDGTGKTTIVRELARRYASEPSFAQAFRAPQFHESPGVPHAALSADIDALSVLADRRRDALLKATSLFLSMTLYGDVERHFEKTFHPELLIGERQPLLDSLVYSIFYSKLLTGPLDPTALTPKIEHAIGTAGLKRIGQWMGRLAERDSDLRPGLDSFWSLPLYAKRVFDLPVSALLKRLRALYAVEEPEEIVVLSVSSDELQNRLQQKRGAGTEGELHERKETLKQLQKGLQSVLGTLREAYPGVRIHELDTSSLSLRETCDELGARLQGNASRLK
jgi:thymidylate kinase